MIDTEALRKKVIDLAIQGKLTEQLPSDGDAETLYAQILDHKSQLIKEGKIKKDKALPDIAAEEIPFEVPENWKWVRIGDVTYNHGQKTPQNRFCYIDVGTLDNVNHKLNDNENIVEAKDAPSRAKRIVEEGDVLYSTVRPYLHNICVVDKDFSYEPIASTAFAVMHTCDGCLENRYLFYWLLSEWFDKYANGDNSKGTLYPAIGEKDFFKGLIPLPPFEEQKRILSLIDEAVSITRNIDDLQAKYSNDLAVLKSKIIDAGIRGKLTEQLPEDGDAEDLYVQILNQKSQLIKEGKIKKEKPLPDIAADEIPFEIPKNWKWVKLGNLVDNIDLPMADGPFGSNLKKEHYTERKEVRIIQLSNVGEDGWKDDNVKYTTFKHLETIKRSSVSPGDIVIAKMMPAGRAIIVPDIDTHYVLSSDCVKFIPHPNMVKKYILYAINSDMFRNQVRKTITGVGRERTSLSKLREFLIPVPPFNEQKRIVSNIEMILQQIQ